MLMNCPLWLAVSIRAPVSGRKHPLRSVAAAADAMLKTK